jgi:hypothetical protein
MTTYRITPRKSWNSQWWWYAFRSSAIAGATPHFLLAKAGHYQDSYATQRYCCWATELDTDTWHEFDNFSIGAVDYEFYNDDPFPADSTIYICHNPAYPYSRVQRKIGEWSASAKMHETASTTDFVFDTATARDNRDGRIAPALNFYAFKLTDAGSAETKNKAVLLTFNHPGEGDGAMSFEGAINFLLGGSAEAETLLDWFEFYCYPCSAPQGLWGGYYRSEPQDPDRDHNYWSSSGVLESIDAHKIAMLADTGGAVHLALDMHAANRWCDGYHHLVVDSLATGENQAFYDAVVARNGANFAYRTGSTSLCSWWAANLNGGGVLKVNGVTEANGRNTYTMITDYKKLGADLMGAIYDLLIAGKFPNHP